MDNVYNVPLDFQVTLYGNLEPFDDSKSKCRVRIFYKGLNRNRTYISEDFANQLISSLPYSPVKGIFNNEDVDFEGHGEKNTEGKIYGLVMAEPNFAWEDHMDTDGVIRTYACADVLLYTSLYNEAKMIPGSSQSMEINPFTFEGEWKIWEEDGQPYYHFKKGSLFGLQVLGTQTEPCFEGSSFYNLMFEKLQKDFLPLMDYVKKNMSKEEEKKTMELDKILFKLSDNQKANKIWDLLNPNFNADGNWEINYCILEVYDEYAVVCGSEGYERVYYTKNEDDTVTIDKKEACYITDVTETEMKALEAMKVVSESFEAYQSAAEAAKEEIETLKNSLTEAEEKVSKIEEYETKIQEFETKVAEYEAKIAENTTAIEDTNTKYEQLSSEKVELEKANADLISEKADLISFKKQIETNQKLEILQKYTEHLTDSIIENLKNSVDNYSVEDFKKEVCTAAVENDPTIFEKNSSKEQLYFKGEADQKAVLTGVEKLLEKYKK